MPTVQTTEVAKDAPNTKRAGDEPIPGYVLLEPLGRGGFGEVWKCTAPGGLHKAMKFVAESSAGDGTRLRREFEAFQQVKAIRHPFLLGLDRVERVAGELVMVMPLADQNLTDRFVECTRAGLPGIPRAELLGYLREAAEALDVIGTRHGLQHLDVKPANLFLTSGHVQVGDFGLVSKLDRGAGDGTGPGYTPRYVPPEVFGGSVHTRSDQYSLALVYQELLTGTFPFPGRTPYQLIFQHASVAPDLSGLPESDRAAVARALAKLPDDRFRSCREFIDVLAGPHGQTLVATPPPPMPSRSVPDKNATIPAPAQRSGSIATPGPRLPRLVGVKRASPPEPAPPPSPPPPLRDPLVPGAIRLPLFLSVLPVAWLRGGEAPDPVLSPTELVRAVLEAAGAPTPTPPDTGTVSQQADGTWSCRFLTTIDPRIARVKLDLLWEQSGAMVRVEGNSAIGRLTAPASPPPGSLFGGFAKKAANAIESGLEVEVKFPDPTSAVGHVVVVGRVFGTPPPSFAPTAPESVVSLLEGVVRLLNNFAERREHNRYPPSSRSRCFPWTPTATSEPR